MKTRLTLEYDVPFGDLATYADALADGRALASKCGVCGDVAFPARNLCRSCGNDQMRWKELPGRARIVHRTDAGTKGFALVKFDGADTHSMVGLTNPEIDMPSGRLVAPVGDAPGLWLELQELSGGEEHES